jgi:small subunit ribosomal protein S16
MLKIRLRRMGAIRQPHYRIVVADSRAPRDGAFIDLLGHYNPLTNPATIQVDIARYEDWKKKGAQPTEAVADLVRQFNRTARNAEAGAASASPDRRTRTASGKGALPPVASAPAASAEPAAEVETAEAAPVESEAPEAPAAEAGDEAASAETAETAETSENSEEA